MIRSVVRGVGACLPSKVMKNSDFEDFLETSDEWIQERTGIVERRIADQHETTAALAEAAAYAALKDAGMDVSDIDFIILATTTPDRTFPSTAVDVQSRLGMKHGFAFDLQAVCSGFVYALTTADFYLKAEFGKRALVIGAETFSRILDWKDRSTCVLFGDGAGALVLEAVPGSGDVTDQGILGASLRSDGSHIEKLFTDGGPSSTQTTGKVRMQGREVFKNAVNLTTDVIDEVLFKTGMKPQDIDWFVPHQANKRIIEASAKKIGIDNKKTIITVNIHGNTSAASIPLALETACRDGRIKKNDLLLLESMGAGFTWGALLLRWSFCH